LGAGNHSGPHAEVLVGLSPERGDFRDHQPAPVAEDDFDERNRAECRAYVAALTLVCGESPPGAALRIKSQNHDFTAYREVVVEFDPTNKEAADDAMKCDEQAPTTWEAAGMEAPIGGWASEVKRGDGWRRA
jgi:hypothetical protein